MKTSFLPFGIIILLLSCQTKTQTEQKADSTTYPSRDVVVQNIASSFTMTEEFDFDATNLYIEPGTSIYKSPTTFSDLVKEINTLTPFTQLSTSTTREPEEGNVCSRYFWYEAKLADGTIGWVYGASVLQRQSSDYTSVEYNEKAYQLYFMTDSGIGPDDENGLTGCDQYRIPFFYDPAERSIQFVQSSSEDLNGNSLRLSSYLNWLSLMSGESLSALFSGAEVSDNFILIYFSVSSQVDGFNAVLKIDPSDHFKLVSFEPIGEETQHGSNEPRDIATVTCTFKDYGMGDCAHIEFSCGDFGTAETSAMDEDSRKLWSDLVTTEDGEEKANPDYVGRSFEITFGYITGWPCQAGYPDTEQMTKGDVQYVTSFKLIEQ